MQSRRPHAKAKSSQRRGNREVEKLVFNPTERIDFVTGFQKRKQERRERAKREAAEQEREVRKLLRQKRREALKRAQLRPDAGHGNEADEEMESDGAGDKAESSGAKGCGAKFQPAPLPLEPSDSG